MLPSITCPNCSTVNEGQSLFCQACGTKLATASVSPQFQGVAPQAVQTSRYGSTSIDSLGARLDGWADLIPDAGNKASDVKAAFDAELQGCNLPQANIFRTELTPGGLSGQRRPYLLVQSYTGATMAVSIGEFGKSLYLAWEIFVRPVLKRREILIMLGVSFFLAVLPQIASQSFSLFGLLFGTVAWMIVISLGAAILGKVLRNSPWAFFVQEIDLFAADDITAMMLATHKSLLRALDIVGVESSTLRSKSSFRAGRHERLI
jgi:hypothetical protein